MQGVICSHIWHKHGERMLLRDITLPLQEGRILCLLGKQSSGKSTLLSILAGTLTPASGAVHAPLALMAREDDLSPRLTAEELLLRALKAKGADQTLTLSRLERLLSLFDLAACRHIRCSHLSGTHREALFVACAVARRPGLLLLDAPCRMDRLSPALREVARESGMMVLFTAADPAGIRYADTAALLLSGRIVQCDAPETLYARPATLDAARFLYPCAAFHGTVTGVRKSGEKCVLDAGGMELDCLCTTEPEVGDMMTLCVRSHHLHVAPSPLPFGQNVSGKVVDVAFSFDEERITVLLPNGQTVTAIRHAEKLSKWDTDDRVFLCWDIRQGHLYPDVPQID